MIESYLKDVDNILRREFPAYWQKIKNSSQYKRKKTWILSQEEITELHQKYKQSNDIQARNLLIYSQLKLVYFFAKEFYLKNNMTSLDSDELLGFANEILINIIDEYDPFKDKSKQDIANGNVNKLPSFIQTWLFGHLHLKMKHYGSLIKQPDNQITDIAQSKKYLSLFENQHARQPYDGEFLTFFDKTNKRATFSEKSIKIDTLIEGKWVADKKIRRREETQVISGNSSSDEDYNLFDTMEADYTTPSNSNETENSVSLALNGLSDRDREIIELRYINEEQLGNIPSLLTPNTENEVEISKLRSTSQNKIDIYIETNDDNYFIIQYDITANHHVEPVNIDKTCLIAQDLEIKMATNSKFDHFNILISNVKNVEIYHKTHKKSTAIPFKYDGCKVSFDATYSYGQIFTAQTILNNQRRIMAFLRKKCKPLKKLQLI